MIFGIIILAFTAYYFVGQLLWLFSGLIILGVLCLVWWPLELLYKAISKKKDIGGPN